MADRTSSAASSGVGLPGLLFLVFLVLKLTGVINWSWWWITAPLWGSFVLFVVIAVIALGIYLIVRK